MDPLAAGFWGAFFGTAALMFAISLAAFFRARRRVALLAALSAVVSAAFVVAYLGWLPVEGAPEARLLAHVAILAAAILAPLLLSLLGLLRERSIVVRTVWLFTAIAVLVIGVGWILEPTEALVVSWISTFSIGTVMMVIALRATARGNRLARTTVAGMSLMLLALGGLSWIALERSGSWPVHALSALAGMGFLSVMAYATWERFSYLLELSEVMAHGPSYDPVTRMRSHSETGQMVGDIFFHRDAEERPVGVLAVCIGNLYALENLHGRAAFNHALFICAGRLRRCVPQTVEMGRLGEDGFLLLTRSMEDLRGLEQLARDLRDQLTRPVNLSIGRSPGRIDARATGWVADVGIGVLSTTTKVRPAQAVGTVRAMARTAWTYATRIAFFDDKAGQIAELPVEAPLRVA
ncbi:7TM diverse intracellular signaling domain-containing protein [Ramlibacter montanisoli]|uniref:Diguanylate cyclase n=1 Tax=Ramlibacter montanisoli TaxID=2732512 RepID=A0A849KBT2_9BURK|nr:7TM diverse intracellular signaling domain-containing protein [Ramlibacter montanisoli]NNU42966.1 diguanylate cyclase [Ramlibacter montanisoli]